MRSGRCFFTSLTIPGGSSFRYFRSTAAFLSMGKGLQDNALHVDRAILAARHVEAVLSVPELDDALAHITHGAVILDFQVLHRIAQAAVEIAAFRRAQRRVHQAVAPGHAPEEKLRG